MSLLLALSLAAALFAPAGAQPAAPLVALDAGHGGRYPGAVNCNYSFAGKQCLQESDVNLDIALRADQALRDAGFRTVLTRRADTAVNEPPHDIATWNEQPDGSHRFEADGTADLRDDLQARVNVANCGTSESACASGSPAQANVFVSVHNNCCAGEGTESYSVGSEQGKFLASLIQEEVVRRVGRRNRGTKESGFYVLRWTRMPASLLEGSFVDNDEEARLLMDAGYRQKLADGVAAGVRRFFAEKPAIGYWLVARDGGIFSFGDAGFFGSMGGKPLHAPMVGMSSTPEGQGYWTVASDGGIFAWGNAGFFGSMGGRHLVKPVVGMAPTVSGRGYWLVASDGGIFSFGDAAFHGSMGGRHLVAPVVAMAASPTGGGYWMFASDGGVFAFGDAPYKGSMGGQPLAKPMVGAAARGPEGYWMVASDGGVFAFGNAPFLGSMGGKPLVAPVVAMTERPLRNGYWLAASDGGVFSFGEAPFLGSMGGKHLVAPVVGMDARTR